jgi:hypothetical protein
VGRGRKAIQIRLYGGLKMYNIEKIWDRIIELEIATQEELELVTSINGYNIDTLNDVIYVRTGYRNIEQLECY